MVSFIHEITEKKPISPSRRVLSPLVSAIVSLLIPGLAQILNGQTLKGLCILFTSFAIYSLNLLNTPVFTILLYMTMIASSSDAYFIASRMKLGEAIRPWSILFLDMHAPTAKEVSSSGLAPRTLITDVTVIDGTGAPEFQADVLLENGVIRCIRHHLDRKEKAYRIVSGKGKLLLPGLISPYSQNENAYFSNNMDTTAIRHGFTTEILGAKGISRAPVSELHSHDIKSLWESVYGKSENLHFFANTGEYLIELDKQIKPVQTESMLGYNNLRANIVALCPEMPSPDQMDQILKRISSGIKSGACGVSLNLTGNAGPIITDSEIHLLISACGSARVPLYVVLSESPELHAQQLQHLQTAACENKVELLIHQADATASLWQIGKHFQNGTLPQWVSAHTMHIASCFGLYDRGLIREGMSADLILLKPKSLPTTPDAPLHGLEKVWVKGELQYNVSPELDSDSLPQKRMFGIRVN